MPEQSDEQAHMTDSERGLRFRIDVACLGYQSLTDDDVPQEYIGTELEAYKEGAADAARAIQSEMRLPPGQDA